MNGRWLTWCGLTAIMALATASTGCATNRLQDERDALMNENQELRQRLGDAEAANAATEAERQRLADELARAQQAQVAAPPSGAANGGTGFGGIAGVETIQSPGKITVRVPGDVLFSSGKVELKSTAQRTLGQIAAVLKRDYASNSVRIEGYTDTDPIRKSKWEDNLELSLQRAAAVHRYLQKAGVSKARMYAAGFGDTRPSSSKEKSRRVEIVVVLNE